MTSNQEEEVKKENEKPVRIFHFSRKCTVYGTANVRYGTVRYGYGKISKVRYGTVRQKPRTVVH